MPYEYHCSKTLLIFTSAHMLIDIMDSLGTLHLFPFSFHYARCGERLFYEPVSSF